mgnify:CR=1 FL=1
MGGDILLGGPGSDILEGKQGDDLIGRRPVAERAAARCRCMNRTGTRREARRRQRATDDLIDDVFADPQRLNPGNITIVKTIVTPVVPRRDCGSATPRNCDTAVIRVPVDRCDITTNAERHRDRTHIPSLPADIPSRLASTRCATSSRLRFSDGVIIHARHAATERTTWRCRTSSA